jgi:hypothetical protein
MDYPHSQKRGSDMTRAIQLTLACAAAVVATAGQVQAGPMLGFVVDGDTFQQPFRIDNTSTSGELVTRFQLELSGTGTVFDTVTGAPPNSSPGIPFTPLGGTGATTGLSSFSVVDGGTLLDINFTDFDPSEFLRWDIDVDFAAGGSVTVFGNQLIGATATIDFSDGQRLIGTLVSVPNNSLASQFTVSSVTTTPPVPEPSSIALLAIGAVGLIGYRRRKRKHAA